MKRILWMSMNDPLDSQLKELKRLFGDDCEIDIVKKKINSVSDILSIYKKGYYDEMVVIAPLTMCRILTEYGYRPLYSEMVQMRNDEKGEIEVPGHGGMKQLKFVKFKRLEGIQMVFSELALDRD